MINKKMLIAEVIQKHPEAIKTLQQFGMGCVMCPASQMESLEEAAMVHGMDIEALISELNNTVAPKEA